MKLLRVLLITAGAVVALLALIITLAFLPSVQTWGAKRYLAGDPSLGITQLGRVDVGLQRVELTDVKIERPGLSLTLPSLVLEMPLLDARKEKIHVRRLVARGWTLDISSAAPVSETPAKTPGDTGPFRFEGIFEMLALPVDLAVDAIDAAGIVIFPVQPQQPAGRVAITLSGGGLGVDKEGRFELTTDVALPDGAAPVTSVKSSSVLTAQMYSPRTFRRIAVNNAADASGPGVPGGARMAAECIVAREGPRETYHIRVNGFANGAEKKWLELEAGSPTAEQPLTGSWAIDLTSTDLAPFALGLALPSFTAAADGRFEADRDFKRIQLAGRSDVSAEELDVIYPGLSTLGRFRVQGEFDLMHRPSGIRVNRLAFSVSDEKQLLGVQTLQALEIVPETGEVKVPAPEADLVRIALHDVPLAWALPFIPPDVSFSGESLRGELIAKAVQGGVSVRTVGQLAFGDLSVAIKGASLVESLDVSLTGAGGYTPGGWEADVSEFSILQGRNRLLVASVRAGQASGGEHPIKATGRLQLELGTLLKQPAAADFALLRAGSAKIDFNASAGSALQQVSADWSFTDLLSPTGDSLPGLSGSLRADHHADGRIEAHLPLTAELRGRRSDLDIAARVQPDGERWAIDAQVASSELYVEDLQAFSALQQPNADAQAGTKTPTSPGKTPAPDAKAVWDVVSGKVQLALKKVVYADDQPPVEINSAITLSPEVLTLESLTASFPDGTHAKADGTVRFSSGETQPYDLAMNLAAADFDPQPYLQKANPTAPPTVAGKFDLTGKVTAKVASLELIADAANVDAALVCRSGRFNGFAASALSANVGKGQENLSKIASAVSILGGALGKSDAVRIAERTRAASDTLRRLVDFNFDQLNIDIAHRAGQVATEIKNFSVISPDFRILGNGTIENSPTVSFLKRALSLDLQMAVRGTQAEDLRILNLLKREADALGYTALAENFLMRGSLSRMAADSLIQRLVSVN